MRYFKNIYTSNDQIPVKKFLRHHYREADLALLVVVEKETLKSFTCLNEEGAMQKDRPRPSTSRIVNR